MTGPNLEIAAGGDQTWGLDTGPAWTLSNGKPGATATGTVSNGGVVKLPSGHTVDMEVVRHPGSVVLLPIPAPGSIILIRQYRYATGGWLLEIPAGKLETDEKPDTCAIRETEEETGFRPSRLEPLGWIWTTPGFCDEKIWLFLATDLEETRQGLDDDEVLELERIPIREAVDKAVRGEIHDGKTVCALLRAARRLGV